MRNLFLSLFFAAALTASGQRFSFGAKAGVPVTSAYSYDSAPYSIVDTGRWTVGPTAEVRLLGDLSFEFDALFRGYRQQSAYGFSGTVLSGPNTTEVSIFSSSRQNAKEWDFPLLLKYRFHAGPVRPFVDAGFEWAHVSSDLTYTVSCLSPADVCTPSGLGTYLHSPMSYTSSVNRRGPVAGLGVEFKYRRLKIAPEVRYSRLTRPTANDVTVLVGFTF